MKWHAHKFWDKVDRQADHLCWPWTGYVAPSGHGLTMHEYVSMYASRKAWILTNGRIEDGKCVLHKCDNAICCNPGHMYLGNRADNMMDLWMKTPAAERAPRGRHTVLSPEDLARYRELREQGMTIKQCCKELGVHHRTLYSTLAKHALPLVDRLSVRASRSI